MRRFMIMVCGMYMRVYEISALDMAVCIMKQMDWEDGDHIMTAINLLKEKFQDELEFNIVSFSKVATRLTYKS